MNLALGLHIGACFLLATVGGADFIQVDGSNFITVDGSNFITVDA